MTLQDIVRQQTHEIRDALSLIEHTYNDLLGQKDAAEDRLKRAFTEVSQHRARETERKRIVAEWEPKVAEIQQKLDEIERQRAELLERLFEKREEKDKAESLLKEARSATEKALETIARARDSIETTAKTLGAKEQEKAREQRRLRDAYVRSIDSYLSQLSRRIDQAFVGQEERQRRMAAIEAFKKARHEDRQIGDLCDQRDQFRQLIDMATVPGVKETLRLALTKIEEELQKRYPGALSVGEAVPEAGSIEDLYYFFRPDGTVSILLPISEPAWIALRNDPPDAAASRAMTFVWGMVKGTGLKPSDGEFCCDGGRCVFVFASNTGDDEISLLEGSTFSVPSSAGLTFRISSLPTEIQEALTDEETDD